MRCLTKLVGRLRKYEPCPLGRRMDDASNEKRGSAAGIEFECCQAIRGFIGCDRCPIDHIRTRLDDNRWLIEDLELIVASSRRREGRITEGVRHGRGFERACSLLLRD